VTLSPGRTGIHLVCWFFVEGGKPENPEKNAWNKARTNNKLNPHTPVWHWAGIEAGPHWW